MSQRKVQTFKATDTSKQIKSHARFLRYASLHSVNRNAATITPEAAEAAVRAYLDAEAAA